ncbi:MAG: NADH-quinone oxidoreductase subunit NuoE [Proteobacteria bacterium]|nr:NADH-quinone oxidoreductase subunit NuoE [Pseudomonadota bacterium]
MSVRRLAAPELQPKGFSFTPDNLAWAQRQIAKYPPGRQQSAVIPLLWRAQEQAGGWLPQAAIEYVAALLGMANIRVLEVATFYTMFLLAPVGRKAHVQVCGTTPCMLRGAGAIIDVCRARIHAQPFDRSADGDFSWEEVECLGACVNAPMVLIGRDTYEDLTAQSFARVLDGFASGHPPAPGPQIARQYSAPAGGPTTLTDASLYAPSGGDAATVADIVERPAAAPGRADAPSIVAAAQPTGEDVQRMAAVDAEALARTEEADIAAKIALLPKSATPEQKADAVGARPQALVAARAGAADDLKRIRGVGPVNESKLNALGVYHFDQIAGWGRAEIRWVETYLAFPGRIDREGWVGQSKLLAAGPAERTSRPAGRDEAAPGAGAPQKKA